MKFNHEIFLTAPLWSNWATVDRWGHIWVYELEPELSECGTYWNTVDAASYHIRIGRVEGKGFHEPRRIKKS